MERLVCSEAELSDQGRLQNQMGDEDDRHASSDIDWHRLVRSRKRQGLVAVQGMEGVEL